MKKRESFFKCCFCPVGLFAAGDKKMTVVGNEKKQRNLGLEI